MIDLMDSRKIKKNKLHEKKFVYGNKLHKID